MADLKQWNGNFEQAVKEQQEKHEQRRREIDKEATTVFTIFFIFVGIMIVCSCVAVCVRWIAVTRAANRVHGPPIMGGGMMMGQPVMGGGMTVGQPGTVMYQQTNCKLIHVKKKV